MSSEVPPRLQLLVDGYKSGKKKEMYISLIEQYKNWATGNTEYASPWSLKQAKMVYNIAFPTVR